MNIIAKNYTKNYIKEGWHSDFGNAEYELVFESLEDYNGYIVASNNWHNPRLILKEGTNYKMIHETLWPCWKFGTPLAEQFGWDFVLDLISVMSKDEYWNSQKTLRMALNKGCSSDLICDFEDLNMILKTRDYKKLQPNWSIQSKSRSGITIYEEKTIMYYIHPTLIDLGISNQVKGIQNTIPKITIKQLEKLIELTKQENEK